MSVIVVRAPVSISGDYVLDCGEVVPLSGPDPMASSARDRGVWCPDCRAWRTLIERAELADDIGGLSKGIWS